MDATQTYHRKKHRFVCMHASNNEYDYSSQKFYYIPPTGPDERQNIIHPNFNVFIFFYFISSMQCSAIHIANLDVNLIDIYSFECEHIEMECVLQRFNGSFSTTKQIQYAHIQRTENQCTNLIVSRKNIEKIGNRFT